MDLDGYFGKTRSRNFNAAQKMAHQIDENNKYYEYAMNFFCYEIKHSKTLPRLALVISLGYDIFAETKVGSSRAYADLRFRSAIESQTKKIAGIAREKRNEFEKIRKEWKALPNIEGSHQQLEKTHFGPFRKRVDAILSEISDKIRGEPDELSASIIRAVAKFVPSIRRYIADLESLVKLAKDITSFKVWVIGLSPFK